MNPIPAHPVLTCDEAREIEARLFAGDEAREWMAMQRAGVAVAAAVTRDFQEIGGVPPAGPILVLIGKGHNGGDALLAARELLIRHPQAVAHVLPFFGSRQLRPLAQRAWQALQQAAPDRVKLIKGGELVGAWALCLDGIFGFQFRPPLDLRAAQLLRTVNALSVGVRAAVDLPSGLGERDAFHADFSYATGSVKEPLLALPNAGRLRYLDLGFFEAAPLPGQNGAVLTGKILQPLAGLRAPATDKRSFGHLFVLGGSRSYPGAVMMAVQAALKSGAGLVTAFVPESLAAAYAAAVPEAMWVGWPETAEGGLALEGRHLLMERLKRADAVLAGPGIGREAETLALIADLAATARIPLVLDADALQPEIIQAARAPLILTPHAGEFARIAKNQDLRTWCRSGGATVVLKGPVTRICAGDALFYNLSGGPVLARGGSGDLLAGIIGSLLAQGPGEPLLAACRGVHWHGCAADALARARGQVAVRATELLEYLGPVLREGAE